MHCQIIIPVGAETVGARIGPDIGAIAAMLAKFDIIDVGRLAGFIDKEEFMLGPIKGSNAAIGLGPDAEVLELAAGTIPGRIQLIRNSREWAGNGFE